MTNRHHHGRLRPLTAGFILLFMLAGCGPNEADLQQTVVARSGIAAAATLAARPTDTPLPTLTAQPSYTPLPSPTPAASDTPAPTLTPRPSLTPVPSATPPPTATATATRPPVTRAPAVPPSPTAPPTPAFASATAVRTLELFYSMLGQTQPKCFGWAGNVCLNLSYEANCQYIVNDYNAIVARRDLAPAGAAEPVATAANIYTSAVDIFATNMQPWHEACTTMLANGEVLVDLRRLPEISIDRRALLNEAVGLMERAREMLAGLEGE